nr:tenascin-R-like [Procambarus clarkii]
MLYCPYGLHYSQSATRASHTTASHTTSMMSWSVLLLSVLLMTAAAHDSEEEQREEEGEEVGVVTIGSGPPLDVGVTPVGSNALNVTWSPPDTPPNYYIVGIPTEDILAETTDTFYLINGLDLCTEYLIVVSSVYDGDEVYETTTYAATDCPEMSKTKAKTEV